MSWAGVWVPGTTYYAGDLVRDGEWLMVATETTTDRPAPQRIGAPFWMSGFGDAPAWTAQQVTAGQVWTGARIIPAVGGFVTAYRAWIPTVAPNIAYSVIMMRSGAQTSNPLLGLTTGWETTAVNRIIRANETVDMYAVADNKAGSTTFAGLWDYQTPNNAGGPASGDISHANKELASLRIHNIDADGGDRSAELATIGPGDTVTGNGMIWTVQANADMGTYHDLTVTPASQADADGVNSFSIEVFAPQPTDYVQSAGHYADEPQVSGLFAEGAVPPTVDQSAFGIDVQFQEADLSTAWDALALM